MSERKIGTIHVLKMLFGIFMVIVYLGMAFLMAINYFGFSTTATWNAIRWFFAVMLALYGIYRCYRVIKGDGTYGMRVYDEEEAENDENQYTTYADALKKKEIQK